MMKAIALSFISALFGLFLSIYSLFIKTESYFSFGWLLFYLSLMLFIWILSLSPGAETGEERGMRLVGFVLATLIIGLIFLIIGYPLLRFYFK
jgi:amino acid transporter